MTVRINADEFARTWLKSLRDLHANCKIAWDVVIKAARNAQIEHGYDDDTGELTSSMKWRTWETGPLSFRGEVVTKAKHALYVDKGTKPHKIPGPGNGPSFFFWPKVGQWVEFTSENPANHPGTTAAQFRQAAIQEFNQRIVYEMEKAIAKSGNR